MNDSIERLGIAIENRGDPVLDDIYNKALDQFESLEEYAEELELQQFALAKRKSKILKAVYNSHKLINSVNKQLLWLKEKDSRLQK